MSRSREHYIHHTERVTRNRNRIYNSTLRKYYLSSLVEGKAGRFTFPIGYPQDTTRFDKIHPMDCGTPGCYMCHADKLKKRRFVLNDAFEVLGEWGVSSPEEFLTNQF